MGPTDHRTFLYGMPHKFHTGCPVFDCLFFLGVIDEYCTERPTVVHLKKYLNNIFFKSAPITTFFKFTILLSFMKKVP